MPKLNCGVNNCAYNAENYCSLNNVKVDGSDHTQHTEGTCCNSFVEDNGAHNSTAVPASYSEIDCEATNCTHNEGCKCCADSIQVSGNGAYNSRDTECSTFCKK